MSLGVRVPRLRFPGFEGEWIPALLKSILHERKTYAEKDGSYPHATLSKEGVYGGKKKSASNSHPTKHPKTPNQPQFSIIYR